MRVPYLFHDLTRFTDLLNANRTNLFAQLCGTICLCLSAGLAAFCKWTTFCKFSTGIPTMVAAHPLVV